MHPLAQPDVLQHWSPQTVPPDSLQQNSLITLSVLLSMVWKQSSLFLHHSSPQLHSECVTQQDPESGSLPGRPIPGGGGGQSRHSSPHLTLPASQTSRHEGWSAGHSQAFVSRLHTSLPTQTLTPHVHVPLVQASDVLASQTWPQPPQLFRSSARTFMQPFGEQHCSPGPQTTPASPSQQSPATQASPQTTLPKAHRHSRFVQISPLRQ